MTKPTTTPQTKMLPIRRRDGTITGYVRGYWCRALGAYVTIPDAD